MCSSKQVFPNRLPVSEFPTEMRESVRHLPKGQKLPNLFHPSLAQDPCSKHQPFRPGTLAQTFPQGVDRLGTVPSKIQIVRRNGYPVRHPFNIPEQPKLHKCAVGKRGQGAIPEALRGSTVGLRVPRNIRSGQAKGGVPGRRRMGRVVTVCNGRILRTGRGGCRRDGRKFVKFVIPSRISSGMQVRG